MGACNSTKNEKKVEVNQKEEPLKQKHFQIQQTEPLRLSPKPKKRRNSS